MENFALRRLQDLEPFEAFDEIAKTFGVTITLYGGTASRAAMRLTYRPEEPLDIFDLAPFSSDIDLDHSGSVEITNDLLTAIHERVPFASWFRWSINDKERAEKAAANRAVSTRVPLRQIRFSTAKAAEVPEDAMLDLDQKTVSFARNPAFRESRLASDQLDVEVYGLLMALNVQAELQEITGEIATINRSAALDWLTGTPERELVAAALNPRLAARFWHLFSMRLARLGWDEITHRLLDLVRSSEVLRNLDIDSLGAPGRAFSVSKFTSSGEFRVPELTPSISTGNDARRELVRIIQGLWRNAGRSLADFPEEVESLIDPAFELLAVIPDMTITHNSATVDVEDDLTDVYYSGMEQEFVEVAWQHSGTAKLDPQGLTAQLVPWDNLAQTTTISSLPAVGGVFGDDRPWVRARFDDLVRGGANGKAALFILQVKDG